MASLLFANNATTNLAGPITATATSLNVAAGTGVLFPVPGSGAYFKLTLQDAATETLTEIMHVTAKSGDTFAILRAQEGTTALNWLAGDLAGNLLTAGSLAGFAQTSNLPSQFYTGSDLTAATNAVVVSNFTPANTAPVAGQYFLVVKGSASNTGSVTLQIGASGSQISVLYKNGAALGLNAWPANAAAILYYTGGVYQFVACAGPLDFVDLPAGPSVIGSDLLGLQTTAADGSRGLASQEVFSSTASTLASYVLTNILATGQVQQVVQNPVVHVNSATGNDTTGTGSSSAPYLTISKAATAGSNKYNFATTSLTIQLDVAGTYAAPGYLPVGSGPINIVGDPANQANYIVAGSGSGILGALVVAQSLVNLTGLTLQNTGSSVHNFASLSGTTCNLQNVTSIVTGTLTGSAHFFGKNIQFDTGCIASGNAVAVWWVSGPGSMAVNVSTVFTISGSPTLSIATLYLTDRAGFSLFGGASVTGAASGKRYLVEGNSVVTTNGGSITSIPGTVAGTTDTGGQYS